jgi:hypothetical protein
VKSVILVINFVVETRVSRCLVSQSSGIALHPYIRYILDRVSERIGVVVKISRCENETDSANSGRSTNVIAR